MKIIKNLLQKGLGEVKEIIVEKVLANSIQIYELSIYHKDGPSTYFSFLNADETRDLYFDENGNKRPWLKKLLENSHDAYDKGFPILLEAYHKGIHSIKSLLINELNDGDYTLLHYLNHSGNMSIFTREELDELCYDENDHLKPWVL